MQITSPLAHSWDLTPDDARAQQTLLRGQVSLTDTFSDDFQEIKTIVGIDLSFSEETNEGHAAVVVLSFPELEVIEVRYATAAVKMPYVPGLLSFRESPIALEAFAQLQTVPDMIFTDGQGQAHPRRFGIACHLGVLLGIPSVGVAKTRLVGSFDAAQIEDAGHVTSLVDEKTEEVLGSVVRTKPRTNPLFISPGHKISVAAATRLVLMCLRGYRLPEPTRQAHNLITAYRKSFGGNGKMDADSLAATAPTLFS